MPQHNSMASFKMMSFIHETLYGLFRDPLKALHAAGLQPGQRVLEVGCGPGFFTLPAAAIVGQGGSVTALDVNPLAVEHVQRKIDDTAADNVTVIEANAAQTDLPEESFDLAFLFGLGRVVGNIESLWAELHRLLKPGGMLAVEGRLRPPERLFALSVSEGRISRFRKL